MVRAVAAMDAVVLAAYWTQYGEEQLAQAVLLASTAHLWVLVRGPTCGARRSGGSGAGLQESSRPRRRPRQLHPMMRGAESRGRPPLDR